MRDKENDTAETINIDYTNMIVVYGDLFKFDEERKHIIEYDNENNRQKLEVFSSHPFYIKGTYDPHTKQFSAPIASKEEGNSKKKIIIPLPIAMTGDRLHERVIEYYNRLSINEQHGYFYVDKALSDRLNGVLPTVGIDGLIYTVDIKKFEISQVGNPEKKFTFERKDIFEPSEKYYNVLTKSPEKLNVEISAYPKDVVGLKFPRLAALDIVGYAEFAGQNSTALVSSLLWKPDSSRIQMVDLSETKIRDIVKNNKVREKSQISKQKRRRKRAGIGGKNN